VRAFRGVGREGRFFPLRLFGVEIDIEPFFVLGIVLGFPAFGDLRVVVSKS
jgi:hypothetical protein